jgi:hypothetical protein
VSKSLDEMGGGPGGDSLQEEWRSLLAGLRIPGLTGSHTEFELLRRDLPAAAAVLSYKRKARETWVVFIGGTGTGKSTLFNGFSEKALSETGVERPKTAGPVSYAHEDSPIDEGFPLEGIRLVREPVPDGPPKPFPGRPGELLVLDHRRDEWRRLVLVDTPDLDSVETENRRMTDALVRLSDAVVFVSSQEKYADEIPNTILARVLKTGKPCFFLLNKAHEQGSRAEIAESLRGFGIGVQEEMIWLIPPMHPPRPERVHAAPPFRAFKERLLLDVSGPRSKVLRDEELRRLAREIRDGGTRIVGLLQEEIRASEGWRSRLETLRMEISSDLAESLKEQYIRESRRHLGEKVRALFARYDVLARPRRFVRGILLTPFRALGLGNRPKVPRGAFERIRKGADPTPVWRALERMHIRVLRELSPNDRESPFFHSLREDGLLLGERECGERLDRSLEQLERWLEETFEELARGIPAAKKWGIYSMSVLWGVLIISLEVAVGGGFSILDAALDSALAPFVTRGAVELFAAQEIRRIGAELGARYQDGLTAPIREQQDRYLRCLKPFLPPPEILTRLEFLRDGITEKPFPRSEKR